MDLSTAKLFTSFPTDLQGRIFSAAARYLAMKEGTSRPSGSFDQAGRFYLDSYHDCCEGMRSPSRAWPYAHMVHARSLAHICHESGIAAYLPSVRKVVRELRDGHGQDRILAQMAALLAKAAIDKTRKRATRRAAGQACNAIDNAA